MNLVETCSAFPEQYDVFQDNKKVAYLRLRWGCFTASTSSHLLSKTLYMADIGHDMTGEFENEEQRSFHLDAALEAIKRELHQQEQQ